LVLRGGGRGADKYKGKKAVRRANRHITINKRHGRSKKAILTFIGNEEKKRRETAKPGTAFKSNPRIGKPMS